MAGRKTAFVVGATVVTVVVLVALLVAAAALIPDVWRTREAPTDDAGPPEVAEPTPPERTVPRSLRTPSGAVGRLNALDVDGVDCDGEGPDDLQAAVDRAVDRGHVLHIPRGAHCRLARALELRDGTRIDAVGATIEALPGFEYEEHDNLVDVIEVEDVHVHGGTWRMLEEGRHVFDIRSCSAVELTGMTATGAGGDGFYVGREPCEDVTLDGVLAEGNGRNGIAIVTGRDIRVMNSAAYDNGHIVDMRGLQIEPNHARDVLVGIRIVNLHTSGNTDGGARINLGNLTRDSEEVDIVVEGFQSTREDFGLSVRHAFAGGTIRFVDPMIVESRRRAVPLHNVSADGTLVEIIRPRIIAWGYNPRDRDWSDSAIVITVDSGVDKIGNVRIVEPTIIAHANAGDSSYYLHVRDDRRRPRPVENVWFINPVRLEGGRGLNVDSSVHIVDDNGQLSDRDAAEVRRR